MERGEWGEKGEARVNDLFFYTQNPNLKKNWGGGREGDG